MWLPQDFRRRITGTYGQAGQVWLTELPAIVQRCVDQWHLQDTKLAPDLSYNAILYANSPEWGPVVLKIGLETLAEHRALTTFDPKDVCRSYALDEPSKSLLLERILPGDNLKSVQAAQERMEIAADIIGQLPRPGNGLTKFATYTDWVNKAFAYVRRQPGVTDRMLHFLDKASEFYAELCSQPRPLMLLHGDFHHENILRSSLGTWKAIDPKGVLGARCLESGRFILNELGETDHDQKRLALSAMTTVFAKRLGESSRTIALCGFVELVLGICWCIESDDDPRDIEEAMDDAQIVLDFIGHDNSPRGSK